MSDPTAQPSQAQIHAPPLGYAALTPLYDAAIALLTRENVWRRRLVQALAPKVDDRILDVGSGTDSLALAIHRSSPSSTYLGIDPDADAITRARRKATRAESSASFTKGHLTVDAAILGEHPTKIVSSLVLHQVPLEEKQRILETMFAVLKPCGTVHIADYGQQKTRLMKGLFRATVQVLDGVSDTQSNADGIIPKLMTAVGFDRVVEHDRIATLTGVISLYRGIKSEEAHAKKRLEQIRNNNVMRDTQKSSGRFPELNGGTN